MYNIQLFKPTGIVFFLLALVFSPQLTQASPPNPQLQKVIDHWTHTRRDEAIPRDLVIDAEGRGFLRRPDGRLIPYAHNAAPKQLKGVAPKPLAKPTNPGDNRDTTPPLISNMQPAEGDTIAESHNFSAVVTDDASGIKAVEFIITYPNGETTQTFRPEFVGNDTWEITLSGFGDGNWSWQITATDNGAKGGNRATSARVNFIVDTGSSGGGNGGAEHITTNAQWTSGGLVQTAAGRIYFEMPRNANRKGPWTGYVCSGTVATDDTTDRSVIITAAHCVYDDANKAFARNVLFIPNQAGTSANGTDTNCSNDPLGCWIPTFGVVDIDWTTRVFPDNIAWDYAFYVVDDQGAHAEGINTTVTDQLDTEAGSLSVSFTTPYFDDSDPSATSIDFTHALGYSYSNDPNFMYCAEDMSTEGSVNWWLPSCELSGGSSGGPWVQPMDTITGSGPIISVNSWGYTTSPGMAGPMLVNTTASCLFTEAKGTAFASIPDTDGDAGATIDYCQ